VQFRRTKRKEQAFGGWRENFMDTRSGVMPQASTGYGKPGTDISRKRQHNTRTKNAR